MKKIYFSLIALILLSLNILGCGRMVQTAFAECQYSKVTSEIENFSPGVYSPSKEQMAFVYYYRESRPLVNGMDAYYTSCPSSKTTKYVFGLYTLNLKTKELTKIADVDGSTMGSPLSAYISWQGDYLTYWVAVHEGNFCYIVPSKGGTKKLLSEGKNPEQSFDGKRIAYVRNNDLWLIKNKENRLIKPVGNLTYVKWADENSLLLYTFSPHSEVYEINLSTLEMTKTTKPYLKYYGLIPNSDVKEAVSISKIKP
jgi:hypothetical protein